MKGLACSPDGVRHEAVKISESPLANLSGKPVAIVISLSTLPMQPAQSPLPFTGGRKAEALREWGWRQTPRQPGSWAHHQGSSTLVGLLCAWATLAQTTSSWECGWLLPAKEAGLWCDRGPGPYQPPPAERGDQGALGGSLDCTLQCSRNNY